MHFQKEGFREGNFSKMLKLRLRVTGILARKNVSLCQIMLLKRFVQHFWKKKDIFACLTVIRCSVKAGILESNSSVRKLAESVIKTFGNFKKLNNASQM